MEKENKKPENKLMWKVLIVLLLVFAVVILVKGEYDKKEIESYSDCSDCMLKKGICTTILNETLIEWKKCIFAVGNLMDMTDEEINKEIDEGNAFYLNNLGGKK